MALLDELAWRGLLHQTTSERIAAHLAAEPRVAYAGFDPTADSLTIGNLVPMMMLAHLQRHGHRPIVLMGGGTGLIGDPSGKSAERRLLTPEQVGMHIDRQRPAFERVLDFSPSARQPATILNNADWLGRISYLDALRDIGKHFSVNMMIRKESVASRLNDREQGISYTEFSYMILQAYDYLHLHGAFGCTLQMGGSDQFGNIVAGIDLIRRTAARREGAAEDVEEPAFGITAPLVTKADGGKIGKSEAGAIYLGAHRTSVFAFHQFWLNASDADVVNYLRWYTFLTQADIEALAEQVRVDPSARAAQRTLAREVTAMIHGETELARAEAAAAALFSGDVRSLDERMVKEVFADVPRSEHRRDDLDAGVALVDLLPLTSLATSKREAREFLGTGAISVNGERADSERRLTKADLLPGSVVLLRRGKKHWHASDWR